MRVAETNIELYSQLQFFLKSSGTEKQLFKFTLEDTGNLMIRFHFKSNLGKIIPLNLLLSKVEESNVSSQRLFRIMQRDFNKKQKIFEAKL